MPDLGLQEDSERDFRYLVDEFRYQLVESTPYRVRFESSKVLVDVVFDGNRSYELDLRIATKTWAASGNPEFSIAEVLRFRGAREAKRFSLVQVTSREAMSSYVAQFARLLRRYGQDLLAGTGDAFAGLVEQRRRETSAYALQRSLRAARTRAAVAWHEKDYLTLVEILKPLRANLTTSEARKLEFAERQVSRSTD